MGMVYRKVFQSLKIDNTKSVELHNSACGTDLSTLSAGGGPNIRYICDGNQLALIERNITNMGASKKTERIINEVTGEFATKYFVHVLTMYPNETDDTDINWESLAENTLPSGYVIISKFMTPEKFEALRPSSKLSDNYEFYLS